MLTQPHTRSCSAIGRVFVFVFVFVFVCALTRVQAAKSIKRAHRANQFGTQALGAMLGALSFFSAGCAHSLDTPIRRAYVQPLPGATHDTKKSVSVSTVWVVGAQLFIVIHDTPMLACPAHTLTPLRTYHLLRMGTRTLQAPWRSRPCLGG